MSRYLTIINYRTLITLLLSLLIPYIAYEFNMIYDVDLTLISIAIIFPLVFTIRGAFRRREKALEHLSRFRASLKTVENLINMSEALNSEEKNEIMKLISQTNHGLYDYLTTSSEDSSDFDRKIKKLIDYFINTKETISGGTKQKIFRFVKDIVESSDNLIAIHTHRTPISLKAYCLIFIYIFPIIYTPTIINKIGEENPEWLTYFVVILSEFILISLYNIQDQMEYPFDDEGLDDIKLSKFTVDR
jgi:hypothetical protein